MFGHTNGKGGTPRRTPTRWCYKQHHQLQLLAKTDETLSKWKRKRNTGINFSAVPKKNRSIITFLTMPNSWIFYWRQNHAKWRWKRFAPWKEALLRSATEEHGCKEKYRQICFVILATPGTEVFFLISVFLITLKNLIEFASFIIINFPHPQGENWIYDPL